jgi:hypothetical protein
MVFPLHDLDRRGPLVRLVAFFLNIPFPGSCDSGSHRYNHLFRMQGCCRLFFRGLEGFYCRCRTTCLTLHERDVVLELAGLALLYIASVKLVRISSSFLVSSPSTATLYDLQSTLNTVRNSHPSGYLMPMKLGATVEEESRDRVVGPLCTFFQAGEELRLPQSKP